MPLQQRQRYPRRQDEDPRFALVEWPPAGRRVAEGRSVLGRGAGRADEDAVGGVEAGEVRDGFAANLAGDGWRWRGHERVAIVVVARRRADEEEAAAAVQGAVGEEDTGAAEAAGHATAYHVVQRPGIRIGGAAVAIAAVELREWMWRRPGRGIHRWRWAERRRAVLAD